MTYYLDLETTGRLLLEDGTSGLLLENTLYSDTILADSPLLYLRLDETSGASCANSGSLGGVATCNGTYARNVATINANLGVGVDIQPQGADADYISYPHNSALDIGVAAVTYECWAKLDSTSINQYLMYAGRQAAGVGGYGLFIVGTSIQVRIAGNLTFGTSSGVWPDTTNWHHVAFTRDGGANEATATYAIYLDGVQIATGSGTNPDGAQGTTFDFQIGRAAGNFGSAFGMDGKIDEVAVYNTTLSSTRIAAHYAAAFSPSITDSSTVPLTFTSSGAEASAVTDTATVALLFTSSGVEAYIPASIVDVATISLAFTPSATESYTPATGAGTDTATVRLGLAPGATSEFVSRAAFRGSGPLAFRNSTSIVPQTVTLPSNLVTGDLMFLISTSYNFPGNIDITVPAGWTLIDDKLWGNSTVYRSKIWYKFAEAGEVAPVVNSVTDAYLDSVVMAYSGINLLTPFDVLGSWSTVTSAFTVPIPAITTTTNKSLHVVITSDVPNGSVPNAVPVGWKQDAFVNGGPAQEYRALSTVALTAGTQAATSIPRNTSSTGCITISFALTDIIEYKVDTGTVNLNLTPATSELYTPFPPFDTSVISLNLSPSGTDTYVPIVGTTKRLFIYAPTDHGSSYLHYDFPTPLNTYPFYVEFSLEWSPTMREAWNDNSGGISDVTHIRDSGTMFRMHNNANNADTEYIVARTGTPNGANDFWQDSYGLYGTAHVSGPVYDRRGKHTFRFKFENDIVTIIVDGVTYIVHRNYSEGYQTDFVRFGWENLFGYDTSLAGTGVYIDEIRIGTSVGAGDILYCDFNDGTIGPFTSTGTYTIVDDEPLHAHVDAGAVKLNFYPSFDTPITRRALCRPANQNTDASYYEYTLATAVGVGNGPVYGVCEVSWLYGDSELWSYYPPPVISLRDASGVEIDGVTVKPLSDRDWRYYAQQSGPYIYQDINRRWPGSGRALFKFRYEDQQIDWSVDGHSGGLRTTNASAGDLKKVRFGWTQAGWGSDLSAAIFVDNVALGLTPAYELVNENFEDGVPASSLAVIGTPPLYPDNLPPGPIQYTFTGIPANSDGTFIWWGGFGNVTSDIFIECDISWTSADEVAWGRWSGYFCFLHDHNVNWIDYFYYAPDDGWYQSTNGPLVNTVGLGSQAGTHHFKVVANAGAGTTHTFIDGVDTGARSFGLGYTLDSIKFGQVYQSDTGLGNCVISNIKVGSTDGGIEYIAR